MKPKNPTRKYKRFQFKFSPNRSLDPFYKISPKNSNFSMINGQNSVLLLLSDQCKKKTSTNNVRKIPCNPLSSIDLTVNAVIHVSVMIIFGWIICDVWHEKNIISSRMNFLNYFDVIDRPLKLIMADFTDLYQFNICPSPVLSRKNSLLSIRNFIIAFLSSFVFYFVLLGVIKLIIFLLIFLKKLFINVIP